MICFQEGCDDGAFDAFFVTAVFLALTTLAAGGKAGEEGPVAEDMLRALELTFVLVVV